MLLFRSHIHPTSCQTFSTICPEAFAVLIKDTLTRRTGCFRDQTWDLVFMRQSLPIQPAQRWIGSKVSDACSRTPHKACSRSFSVPEISGVINFSGIPVETAVKLQRPQFNPSCKNTSTTLTFRCICSKWHFVIPSEQAQGSTRFCWDKTSMKNSLSLSLSLSFFLSLSVGLLAEHAAMFGLHENKTERPLKEERGGK